MHSPQKNSYGFSPVEVLLASTLFGVIVTGMIGALIYGQLANANSGDRIRATMLADEGVQAVRSIRNLTYGDLVNGTFGLVQVAGKWTLSGASDASSIYTRETTISATTVNTKLITSTVSWTQNGSARSVSVKSILSNWAATVKTWVNTILMGSYDASGTTNAYKVATQGNFAYLIRNSTTGPNFIIINISNPAAPVLVGSLTLANIPTGVAVSGNYAYISNSGSATEMQTVNITTPSAPTLTSTYNAAGNAGGLSIFAAGTTVYLGRASNGGSGEFLILNVAVPATPTVTGSYGLAVAMNEIAVAGNFAYVATNSGTQELIILSLATPALPTRVSLISTTGTAAATGVAVAGTVVYIVAGTLVTAIDVTVPATPSQLGTYTLLGTGAGSEVVLDDSGTYLFVGSANTTAELRVLSVATPATITLSKTINVTGTASTIFGLAYSPSLNLILAASASDTQELLIYGQN